MIEQRHGEAPRALGRCYPFYGRASPHVELGIITAIGHGTRLWVPCKLMYCNQRSLPSLSFQ
jgi:hypothetical protein